MLKVRGKQLLCLLLGIAAILTVVVPTVASAEQIDVLVLYDDYSARVLGGEPAVVMRSWENQINTFYRSSNIDLQMRIVGVERNNVQVNASKYEIGTGKAMGDVLNEITPSSKVAQTRNNLGADFVTQMHEYGNCGVGWAAVNAIYAFNVIGPTCGPMAMAHEIGHNMGLNHSRTQGDRSGVIYRYGVGHLQPRDFGTIMTYADWYGAKWMPVFSNPRIQCNGQPCGVPEGQSNEADAAKAINNVRARLADFRPTKIAGGDTGEQCQEWTATNDQHVSANRAYKTGIGFGCEPVVSGYAAVGTEADLGTDGSTVTTLHSFDGEPAYYVGNCPEPAPDEEGDDGIWWGCN